MVVGGNANYTITGTGRKKLASWLAIPADKEYVRYEILSKLFFGGLNSPNVNINNIRQFQNRNQSNLDTPEQFESELRNIIHTSPDHLYYWLTVLFGKYIYQAYLQWADEAITYLKNRGKAGESHETATNSQDHLTHLFFIVSGNHLVFFALFDYHRGSPGRDHR